MSACVEVFIRMELQMQNQDFIYVCTEQTDEL